MLEVFCLRLAAGLALSLLFLPAGEVQPRFHRIHLLIVLALVASSAALAWRHVTPDVYWVAIGLAAAGAFVGTLAWAFEGAPGAGIATVFTAAAALVAATSTSAPAGAAWIAWTGLDHATSAALLGAATTAMLLGHWYLIAPTLSIRPLLRQLGWLFAAVGLRLAVAAAGLWSVFAAGTIPLDATAWMWLGVRWAVGLVGVAALGWMAWQAARIRSTQSATGILYVVVIFAFLGELTDQLLQEHLLGLATVTHEHRAAMSGM